MTALLLALAARSLSLAKLIGEWLSRRSLAEIACILLALFAAYQTVSKAAEHRQNIKLKSQIEACSKARATDRAGYEAAQLKAEADNKRLVAEENKLRRQISEASKSGFVSDRDRLRSQSGAAQGAPGATGSSGLPHAAPGTPPEVLSLPPAELLRAQELELQLNALIDWVAQQKAVQPSDS